MKNSKIIIGSFFLLSFINLLAVLTQWQNGIYLSKPLLMTSLSIWFFLNTKDNFTSFARYIFLGIIFSIAGDTFLMFVNKNPNFFLFGLISFLITHLFYIIAFIKYPGFKNGMVREKTWVVLPVAIYLILFSYFLWPDITAEFKVAVLFYSCIISTMLVACINMKWRVTTEVSTHLIIGAVLFVFSDSVIALDKFKTLPIPSIVMSFIIMVTYIAGQYTIANSCIKINKEI